MREWWSKLARALHLRRGLDDDLSDEMRAHLELMTDDNLERGMSTSEARAAARRHFGNLTRTREKAREAWRKALKLEPNEQIQKKLGESASANRPR